MEDVDVIVVGGGLSGLAAARRLVAEGIDRVVVLEARDEPGGKCVGQTVAGCPVDTGAGWTAPTQEHVQALAAAYGVETYSVEVPDGKLVSLYGGVPAYRALDDLGVGDATAVELERVITELETLCAQVDPARPWASERADELDAVTAEAWIRAQTEDHDAQDFLGALFHTTTASPRQLSMLSAVTFIASCGGVAGLETEAEQLFVGGAAAIPQRIAQELGDRVRLGAPVSEIAWSADGALVRTAGDTLRARRVIVAMSPSDARRIVFRPGLPAKREMLHKAWFSGSAIKAVLVYDRPFWREPDGERPAIAGWSVNDAGCPSVVLDATPPDAGVGVLAAFTALLGEGERFAVAHDVLDDAEARRSRMLENVALMYGPQAAEPVDVVETHWGTEPYIGGCLGFAPPGLLTQCGDALRTPVGPVHWAGAEAADVWINHLNGAVQAGERAADEVVAALGAHDAAGATAS